MEGDEGIESVPQLGREMKGADGMKGEEHRSLSPSHGDVVFALALGAAVGEIERSIAREREREKEREEERERGREREKTMGLPQMWVLLCVCVREREREREDDVVAWALGAAVGV